MKRLPTDEQVISTHKKLSVMQSSRLIQFINARDNALEALQPKNKKDSPNIEKAIEYLLSTKENHAKKEV